MIFTMTHTVSICQWKFNSLSIVNVREDTVIVLFINTTAIMMLTLHRTILYNASISRQKHSYYFV